MGESKHQAWKRCNREKVRATSNRWKKANREANRERDRRYSEENRATCPECGHIYGRGSGRSDGSPKAGVLFSCCPGCTEKRRRQVVEWWAEGVSLREIGKRLGWTRGHVAVEIDRMRELGYALPYRYKPTRPRHPEQVAA
jgi:hypothetical protein